MSDSAVCDSLSDRVSKFNDKINSHAENQSLNPFSGCFKGAMSRSPSPRPSKEEYGKPPPGSKTEERGKKAHTHICREILDLCTVINDMGTRKKEHGKGRRKKEEEEEDDEIIVSFGELFELYTKISDKVVGLLIAAKKRGLVYFEPEILFQRRDDNVLIALLKPMSEIRKTLQKEAPDIVYIYDENAK